METKKQTGEKIKCRNEKKVLSPSPSYVGGSFRIIVLFPYLVKHSLLYIVEDSIMMNCVVSVYSLF